MRSASGAVLAVIALFMAAGALAWAKPIPKEGLWVTFDVLGERFRAVVTEPDAIAYVLDYVAGQAPQRVPNGIIRRGGKCNAPYSWHLEPSSVEFADSTTEVCDGRPSYLEAHFEQRLAGGIERYCPWRARITSVKDCRSGRCVPLNGLYAGRSPAF